MSAKVHKQLKEYMKKLEELRSTCSVFDIPIETKTWLHIELDIISVMLFEENKFIANKSNQS